jgi:hypothetical protein
MAFGKNLTDSTKHNRPNKGKPGEGVVLPIHLGPRPKYAQTRPWRYCREAWCACDPTALNRHPPKPLQNGLGIGRIHTMPKIGEGRARPPTGRGRSPSLMRPSLAGWPSDSICEFPPLPHTHTLENRTCTHLTFPVSCLESQVPGGVCCPPTLRRNRITEYWPFAIDNG